MVFALVLRRRIDTIDDSSSVLFAGANTFLWGESHGKTTTTTTSAPINERATAAQSTQKRETEHSIVQ